MLESYDEFLTKLVPGMDVAQYLDGVKPVTQEGNRGGNQGSLF